MTRENAGGARTVLQAGMDAGCGALVHVSSTVALARPGGGVLDHTSPLGSATGPYSASKIASEQVARELQAAGAPVTIVNPGGILGPHDPYLGENNHVVRLVLRGVLPAWPRGRFQYVDVRDVATVLAAAVDHDGVDRFLVPGTDVARPHDALREVTGRRLPAAPVPVALAVATAWPGDLTGWAWLPRGAEGSRLIGFANTTDAAHTTQELEVSGRPLTDSLRDTIRWMVDAGHISRRQAGKALG
jgi:nucleoside-diphosphate-sugar epimerase